MDATASSSRDSGRPQQMKVKVLFTLQGSSYPTAPHTAPLIRIARLSEAIYVIPRTLQTNGEACGGELLVGDVSAKTCLYGIAVTQPELLMDPSKDYSLSVLDVVESTARRRARKVHRPFSRTASSTDSSPMDDLMMVGDSPSPNGYIPESPEKPKGEVFEGKGMMRWVMGERAEGKTMLTGKVVKRQAGDLLDTLELSLRLTERSAVSRTEFVESMCTLANPPATPIGASPHLNSPSADGFLSRLLRNEITSSRSRGSPPRLNGRGSLNFAVPTAATPLVTDAALPNIPPEFGALIRQALAPNGQPTGNPAPEVLQAASTLLRYFGASLTSSGSPGAETPVAGTDKENVAPKKRAPLTTRPLPARRRGLDSQEEPQQDAIRMAGSAGSSLAIRPTVLPATKRPRTEPQPIAPAPQLVAAAPPPPPPPMRPAEIKRCTNCGTTESKVWRTLKTASKAESGKTRVCNRCGIHHNRKGSHRTVEEIGQRGHLARSTSAKTVAQSSPPRASDGRRASLPQPSFTSPVRSSRRLDGIASDGDDDLPPASILEKHRNSRLFQSDIIPPSSDGPEEDVDKHHLPEFVLNASPGTALHRIMSAAAEPSTQASTDLNGANKAKSTKSAVSKPVKENERELDDMAAFLFSNLSPVHTPGSDGLDLTALLTTTSTTTVTTGGITRSAPIEPAPSSSGLTDIAMDLDLTSASSPETLVDAHIFGSPSKWAMLDTPGSTDASSLLEMLKHAGARDMTSNGHHHDGFYDALFGSLVR